MVSVDKLLDTANFCPGKAATTLQPTRVKPELRDVIITLNVNMWRFILIPRIEEKTIWSDSEYRWHLAHYHVDFLIWRPELIRRAPQDNLVLSSSTFDTLVSMLANFGSPICSLRSSEPLVSLIHRSANLLRAS